jgi:hypothetical protein
LKAFQADRLTFQPTAIDVEAREFVLRVDFDLVDDDGCVQVSLRWLRGRRPPGPGEIVYLLDGNGRGCTATVESVTGWYAHVRPNWSTFTGGPLPAGASF